MNQDLKFLKTLKRGLLQLQKNPSLNEVGGIPFTSFDVLVQSFGSNLTEELRFSLKHDLRNLDYVNEVLGRISALLAPEIKPETLEANLPNVKLLLAVYEKNLEAHKEILQEKLHNFPTFAQQVKKHNDEIIYGLRIQLQGEFPDAPEEKINVVTRDLASTIQAQTLESFKTTTELRETVKPRIEEVTRHTLGGYVDGLIATETTQKVGTSIAKEQVLENIVNKVTSSQIPSIVQNIREEQFLTTSDAQAIVLAALPYQLQGNNEVVTTTTNALMERLQQIGSVSLLAPQVVISQAVEDTLSSPPVVAVLDKYDIPSREVFSETTPKEIADELISQRGSENLLVAATLYSQNADMPTTPITPLEEISSLIKTATVVNLPKDIAPEVAFRVADEVCSQALGRLSAVKFSKVFDEQAQEFRPLTLEEHEQAVLPEVQRILASQKIQQILSGSGQSFSPQQQKQVAQNVVSQISPNTLKWSASPEATMIGTMVAPIVSPRMPNISVAQRIPQIDTQADTDFIERFQEAYVASSPTDFLFFGLSTPSWKTLPVGVVGLTMDTIGIVPVAHTSMLWGYLSYDKPTLTRMITQYSARAALQKIVNPKESAAYRGMANYLSAILTVKEKTPPALQPFVHLGEIYGRWQRFNMKISGPTGINPLKILELGGKYGLPGFTYGTDMMLKVVSSRMLGAGLHAALPGLFKYDELSMEVYFKYGLKGITKEIKKYIFNTVGPAIRARIVNSAAGKAFASLLAKLGISAIGDALSGGSLLLLQAAWFTIKKLWKIVAGGLGLLLFWLFSNFSPLTALAALASGFGIGSFFGVLFGPWGFFVGFMLGTPLAAFLFKTLGSTLSPLLQGASSLLGNFLNGLGGIVQGISSAVAPVGAASLVSVVVPTLVLMNIVSSAFEIPGQPSPVQSKYIEVSKLVDFSGKLGDPINYTLTVTALAGKLTNVKVLDIPDLTCKGTAPTVAPPNCIFQTGTEIATSSSVTCKYQILTDPTFNDCLITNSAQVTADVPDLERWGEQSFTSNAVSIGNPPVVLPRLPLSGNVCLSGYGFNEVEPDGTVHKGVDIVSTQTSVVSPFAGPSRVTDTCKTPDCIADTAGGYSITLALGPYVVYMGHLANPTTYFVNDSVPAFATVGTMGHTGQASGDHVHYVVYKNGTPIDPASIGQNIPACGNQ